MEVAIHTHFSSVFGQPGPGGFTVDYNALGIQPIDLTTLELPFTEEEIQTAVCDMPSDRAPGPDGFTGAFCKLAWPIIKDDIVAAINALFFGDSRMFHKLNNAFVVLLPKKPEAESPADYRPITMIQEAGLQAHGHEASAKATEAHLGEPKRIH